MDAGTTALTIPGRLAWDEDRTVRVHSPFAGRVIRPLVQVGDPVRAGQPLAELVSSEFGQAVADARRAQTDLTLAHDSLERQRELHDAGLIPLKDLRAAQAEHSRAEIEAQRAQTRLRQTGSTGSGNYSLRAPISGVVVERSINPGQELRADQDGAALFVVTDPSRLWAWLDAPERALPQLSGMPAGTALRIRSAAWGDTEFGGQLVRKEDAIDPELRTFRLRASVGNAQRKLKSGMFVTAIFAPPVENAAMQVEHVPLSAVILMEGKRHVFVQDDESSFTRQQVNVIAEQAGRASVTGLRPGQRVVTEGNLYLQQILSRNGDPAAAAKSEARK
jgi:cobalt-zinc-cadmium efflux system membrane fusion protein